MKNATPLLLVIMLLSAATATLVGYNVWFMSGPSPEGAGSAESIRDYAAALKANQLYKPSAEQYDRYVQSAALKDSDKARVDFNTANMLFDHLSDYEGALAHFLRITDLYKDVESEILKESRKRAAECLEKLGRSGAAEQQLIQSSKLHAATTTTEIPVDEKDILAKIGERVSITRTEFEQAWNELPAYAREQAYKGEQGKEKFLQEMVSMRLFSEAARRKGLERDPEISRRLRMFEDSLLASKLLQEEISSKISLPDSDLHMFFQAHRAHFVEPAAVEVAQIVTGDATSCVAAKAQIEHGSPFGDLAKSLSKDSRTKDQGGKLGKIQQAIPPAKTTTTPFDPLDVAIPGIGKNKEYATACFSLEKPGQLAGPIRTDQGYHLIQLISKTPTREKSFDEVKTQVESELRQQREDERRTELVAELIKTHKMRVYPERLKD